MDDIERCGNDLRWLEWFIHHPHNGPGDPFNISALAKMLESTVELAMASRLSNTQLQIAVKAQAGHALLGAAQQLAAAKTAAGA